MHYLFIFVSFMLLSSCANMSTINPQAVTWSEGIDVSAGGDENYIIHTPLATFYLEKQGGGLSSMVDKDGVDWIGFHKAPGSGWKGEYRGFPNAIHKQDGSYFHAMNSKTISSSSRVTINTSEHVQIIFTSQNQQWEGIWDFYVDRLDFTMSKVSTGYYYWIQYEGVPGGSIDKTDYWYASVDDKPHPINEHFLGDLPDIEWMAFGDQASPRVLFMLHHTDDTYPDNYESRPDMTVFAFGRSKKNKFLSTPSRFSIGFVESTDYAQIQRTMVRLAAQSK